MLLSTNLARERLQIDTDLLRTITSTADELSGGTNIDELVHVAKRSAMCVCACPLVAGGRASRRSFRSTRRVTLQSGSSWRSPSTVS